MQSQNLAFDNLVESHLGIYFIRFTDPDSNVDVQNQVEEKSPTGLEG